ncbi:MAG: tetratricopeptide repeat protein [Verrucomicrobiae bacterium]|nr:tetratricopeptide repeat protein [Verrucomicrobiae bacterium]
MNMHRIALMAASLAVAALLAGCASSGTGAGASPAQQRRAAQLGILAQLPPYYGPKKLIAVMDFQNKSNYKGKMELGTGMADSLTDALIRSERFIVVERQQIRDVLKEQDFAQTGRTVEAGAPKIGRVLNTQALIYGTVVDFSETQEQSQAFGYQGFNLSMAHAEAKVTIVIRVVDSTTGQVLDSQQIEGKAEKRALGLAYAEREWAFGSKAFVKTPLGQATQEAIDKAVLFICQRLQDVPWEGRVIDAKDSDIYINAGEQQGIAVGDCFVVFREGEAMVDPATGLPLGAPRKEIGAVEVSEVQPKFAVAKVLRGAGIARRDIVRFVPVAQVKGALPAAKTVPPPPDTPGVTRARELLSRNDRSGALREVEAALKANPADAAAAILKLQLEVERRDFRAASRTAAQVVSLRPDDPAALLPAAQAQSGAGDYAGAVATLNRLLTVDPNNIQALVLRSQALANTGDNAGSYRDMRRAINLGYQAPK